MAVNLIEANKNNPAQVFPLVPGLVNLTSGEHSGVSLIHCVADGDVVLDGGGFSSVTISMEGGQDFAVMPTDTGLTVTISTGTFHLA